MTGDGGTPTLDPRTRLAWRVALAFALLYPLAFVTIAVLRIGHPYELEWMEGGAVGHVQRILAGLPLYVEPSLEFTPFIYPPLYFHVSAWVARFLGADFLALRLVSLLSSLGCIALIFAIVRRRTGDLLAPTLAACLFAASYREGGAWFDVARNDPLHLLLMLAGIWALLRPGSPWLAGGLSGLAFALSALTKQSALFVAVPVALWLLVADWRRGLTFGTALVVITGGVTLWLERASGGWYLYYVFQLPRDHPIIGQLLRGFWTSEFLGVYGLALAIAAFRFFRVPAGNARAAWLDAVLLLSLILTAYATKIRVGSFDNLILPAHVAASLGFGWGLGALRELASELPVDRGRVLERYAVLLVLATFTLTLYKPWRQLPPRSDLEAGAGIVESLRRVEGDVWVPSHPYLAVRAGKPGHAHELAITDVLRPVDSPQHARLMASLRAALRERRWQVVVLDHTGWLREEVLPYYDHAAQMFGSDEPDRFWSTTGYRTRPDYVWIARPDSAVVP